MTTYLNKEVYEKLVGKSIDIKTNKYKNQKMEYDGILWDSKKEMSWYIKFKLMEKAGEIEDLQRQKEYIIIEPFKVGNKKYRKTSYYADFYYKKNGIEHIIDIKSEATKTPVYKLKKKLMAYKYGIEIEEL